MLYYYQLEHGRKVYKSWATTPAIPPVFREEGGGEAGEWMRYLARPDPDGTLQTQLIEISRKPEVISVLDIDPAEFQKLAVTGNYRHLVVHERGYYLLDPQRGALLYRDVVRQLALLLEQEPEEHVELQWFDYPGNAYTVPDGPVYVPWSSQEVNLPDREMPERYFMAVFDLSPLIESWEGPSAEELLEENAASSGGPVHREMPPGAP